MEPQKISVGKFKTVCIALFAGCLVICSYSETEGGFKPDIKKTTIDLSTNMVCGTAKRIIEKALNKVDGIIDVEVDPETKTAVVTYDDSRIKLKKIERAITKLGYDANDKKGDPEAYERLPDCCKTR